MTLEDQIKCKEFGPLELKEWKSYSQMRRITWGQYIRSLHSLYDTINSTKAGIYYDN